MSYLCTLQLLLLNYMFTDFKIREPFFFNAFLVYTFTSRYFIQVNKTQVFKLIKKLYIWPGFSLALCSFLLYRSESFKSTHFGKISSFLQLMHRTQVAREMFSGLGNFIFIFIFITSLGSPR